jgi:hypothetical protein
MSNSNSAGGMNVIIQILYYGLEVNGEIYTSLTHYEHTKHVIKQGIVLKLSGIR